MSLGPIVQQEQCFVVFSLQTKQQTSPFLLFFFVISIYFASICFCICGIDFTRRPLLTATSKLVRLILPANGPVDGILLLNFIFFLSLDAVVLRLQGPSCMSGRVFLSRGNRPRLGSYSIICSPSRC